MIDIDKISFRFIAQNELFAFKLYEGWDEFCTRCVENVLDEYLSPYDMEDSLTEIDCLKLDLGNIPEDDFYQLFPIRLRETLERSFSLISVTKIKVTEHFSEAHEQSKLSGLWYYLEHGFCRTARENEVFQFEESLRWLIDENKDAIVEMFQKILENRIALERLLLQSDNVIFVTIISVWLNDDSIPINEKRKQLSRLATKYPFLLWRIIEKIGEDKSVISGFIEIVGTDIDILNGSAANLSTQISDVLPILTNRYPELFQVNQMDDDSPESEIDIPKESADAKRFYWLTDPSINRFEKRRWLAAFLDRKPLHALRFIAMIKNEQMFESLAEIIDEIIVIKLLTTISRQNVYAGNAIFWLELYDWLIEHYTTIGFSSFNSQQAFQRQLNLAVLHLLRKNDAAMLSSKLNLTSCLLKELFDKETGNVLQIIRKNTEPGKSEKKTMDSFEIELHLIVQNIIKESYPENISADKIDLQQNIELPTESISQSKKETNLIFQSNEEFLKWVENKNISIELKKSRLTEFAFTNPDSFHSFIGTIDGNSTTFLQLSEIVSDKMLLQWIASLSIAKAELLKQILELLDNRFQSDKSRSISKTDIPAVRKKALLLFLKEKINPRNDFLWEDDAQTTEQFIRKLLQTDEIKKYWCSKEDNISEKSEEQTIKTVLQELSIKHSESEDKVTDIEYLFVPNAGLALLTPWFPQLFDMLGLLCEGKKDLKDTESKIRAIFIIQQLVSFEDKEYREHELAFNRILTGCPFSIPLPKKMELTSKETDTIKSMLEGVKANWPKMKNTSTQSFQTAFIERAGKLKQQEDKWLLTVEPRFFDMLLDSLPWSYKLIRFPWLKKHIHVSWRDDKSI